MRRHGKNHTHEGPVQNDGSQEHTRRQRARIDSLTASNHVVWLTDTFRYINSPSLTILRYCSIRPLSSYSIAFHRLHRCFFSAISHAQRFLSGVSICTKTTYEIVMANPSVRLNECTYCHTFSTLCMVGASF